jgi:hypothetical protein
LTRFNTSAKVFASCVAHFGTDEGKPAHTCAKRRITRNAQDTVQIKDDLNGGELLQELVGFFVLRLREHDDAVGGNDFY